MIDKNAQSFVMSASIVILIGLFGVQRYGTHALSRFFSPIMLCWFVVIGLLGFVQVLGRPDVLNAVSPVYALDLAAQLTWPQLLGLFGSVLLAATGADGQVRRRVRAFPSLSCLGSNSIQCTNRTTRRLFHWRALLDDVEDQSGTFAGVPPWQVERQAGVFLDLLKAGGRTNPQELRQLVRAFVQNYAGDQASKPLIRSVMNELNEVIETGAKRRLG
jgi:hypothetical protein